MKLLLIATAFGLFSSGSCNFSKISFPYFTYNEEYNEPYLELDGEPFIVGGKDAVPGEFPWQVSLQKDRGLKGSFHFCGGSIVDPSHVVTASHCTIGQDPGSIWVVAGAHNMKDKGEGSQQRRRAKALIQNPKYNSRTINFDTSVIELETPFEFNERVAPIRLPPPGHDPSGKCMSSGWGNANKLGFRPVVIPNALQKVNMTVVSRGLCRIPYLFFARAWLTGNMVCGGASPFKGSCNGDSGGPLVCFDLPDQPNVPYLAGVTSFGVLPCGQALFPSVFANVGPMRDFLDKHLQLVQPGGKNVERNGTEKIL